MVNFQIQEEVNLWNTVFKSFDDLAQVVIKKYLDFKFIEFWNLSTEQKKSFLSADVENNLHNL